MFVKLFQKKLSEPTLNQVWTHVVLEDPVLLLIRRRTGFLVLLARWDSSRPWVKTSVERAIAWGWLLMETWRYRTVCSFFSVCFNSCIQLLQSQQHKKCATFFFIKIFCWTLPLSCFSLLSFSYLLQSLSLFICVITDAVFVYIFLS